MRDEAVPHTFAALRLHLTTIPQKLSTTGKLLFFELGLDPNDQCCLSTLSDYHSHVHAIRFRDVYLQMLLKLPRLTS